ncbi:ubiquitin carboxyl-terminal hydrolase 8 isoform X2 [Parasteatoda tepidariorum]|uniref:ubiquitin carboxyl-terminal hydrolase 8 isoform X2 n=1 Tax=Parasteatoda tepidariorum TaxID=114398 RepID=UPI00077FB177|nr:ubiquitin carboxyl-terminal hydrolase 8 isoform X2 [Parasteatoda tepidariorum]
MPASSVKPLYIAKSMKELDGLTAIDKTDYKKKSTSLLVSSANTIFQGAEKSSLERDEEKAYTLFVRYVELILFLQSRDDFKKTPSYKSLCLQTTAALVKAESLKASLTSRYLKNSEEIEAKNNSKIKAKNDKNELLSSLHNNKITDTSAADPVETTISSSKLYSLLSKHSNIVIMDIRSAIDFEQSHLKHNCCINIPQEILTPGITALTLEKLLPDVSRSGWLMRGDVDYVILIDWDSKDNSRPSLYVNTLKEAMCKWDQKRTLKKLPLILDGGYKDWMLKYPMWTTQAINIFNSDAKTSPVVADLSGVEYPNLDENTAEKKNENLNGTSPLFKKSTAPFPVLNNDISPSSDSVDSRKTKSAPSFDRKAKPAVNKPTSATSQQATKNVSGKISSSDINGSFPVHSEKLPNKNQESAIHLSLKKEEMLAQDSLHIAKERLIKEQEFEKLCLRKEKEAEESKRIEIQKQENILADKLKQLDITMTEKDAECKRVREENLKMKKRLEEYIDKEAQAKKEREIMNAEQEKKDLLEQVKRLREERKMKEAKKKLEPKPDAVPRNTVSANSGLKRPLNNHDQNEAPNSEYTVPLSRQSSTDSGSRGLVRSHSSPNIAQLVNQEESSGRKLPAFDRSLKPPPISPYSSDLSRARLRNLNPVYGNCPATGLRNLGNTCFMNSVIQCLANTLPLVDYFISNQYLDDIVKDSRQSMSGEVAEEFAIVLKSLWMGQYKSFSPKDFKNTVSKCLSVCIGNEQQDSHEFFVVLMEKLHADLNRRTVKNIPKLDPSHDEGAFWQHHKSYNDSKVSESFEGLLKSTLRCLTCQKTSDSFEVFSCLSLPILNSRCSLRDCFKHFLKSEKISGEAAWECPRCKQKKEAEKRLQICRLPEILAIQLKRFSYEGLWRRKLQTHVDFDISFEVPYERNGEEHYQKYTLYGIVNHYGTLEGGHYIAFCNAQTNKWFRYDDHEVSEISSSDIKTSAAYMLFYQATEVRSNL